MILQNAVDNVDGDDANNAADAADNADEQHHFFDCDGICRGLYPESAIQK